MKEEKEKSVACKENIYSLEGRVPLQDAIPLGLQHVLAMFAANLTPLLVVVGVLGLSDEVLVALLQNSMFVAGLATVVQLYPLGKIGSGLPVVMGTSSSFITVSITAGLQYGYGAILGASLCGAILEFFLGFVIKPLRKLLPHVVTGTVVTTLGISLIPIGIQFIGGGVGLQEEASFGSLDQLFLGAVVMGTIIFVRQFAKGVLSASSILVGIVVGYLVAIPMGHVDFTAVKEAGWFSIPKPFFLIEELGGISFHMDAIIPIVLVFLATTVETIGDNTGVAMGGLGRDITDDELQGAVHADGFSSCLATFFGSMPNTSFSQNVGLVGMTKIVNRFTIFTGVLFLIISAFIPKLGALITTIPNCVLGGGVLLMFAMITMSGLNLLYDDGKLTDRDAIIVATSLGIAFGLSLIPEIMKHFPAWVSSVLEQAIVGAFLTSAILNQILPKEKLDTKSIW